jgi:hypothetical protein
MKQKKSKENLDEIVSLLCSDDPASHAIALGLIKPLKAHTAKLVDKWVKKALVVHIADASTHVLKPIGKEIESVPITTAIVLGEEYDVNLIEEWYTSYGEGGKTLLSFKADIAYMIPNRYEFAIAGWYERGTTCTINPNFRKESKAALNLVLLAARKYIKELIRSKMERILSAL